MLAKLDDGFSKDDLILETLNTLEQSTAPLVVQGVSPVIASAIKQGYCKALKQLTAEELIKALTKLVPRGLSRFPSVDEIMEAALGSPRQRAINEWESLVLSKGQEMPVLSNAGRLALSVVGGFPLFKHLTTDQLSFTRRDFVESYTGAVSQGASTRRQKPKQLPPPPMSDEELRQFETETEVNGLTDEQRIENQRKLARMMSSVVRSTEMSSGETVEENSEKIQANKELAKQWLS